MKKLLIIEDDETFAASLVRALSRRGYACVLANTCAESLTLARETKPTHILMDLNLENETTQSLVPLLKKEHPQTRLVVLTGLGTIPSTVQAIKDGADHYLCKPATPDTIQAALEETSPFKTNTAPLWELENDHILKVIEQCGGNITQAAKNLGLHRRTLQRRLKKI